MMKSSLKGVRRVSRGAGVVAVVASLGAWAVAEEVASLPPVVVEASRTERTTMQMPSGVTLVTGAAIERSGAQDTVQALENLGGLYFRKINGNPVQAEAVMGGFGQNAHGRVLVLVDGQRLNEPDMKAPNWSAIPVGSIERIEVLHGAHTVLYGNHAVGGVINIITKKDAEPYTSLSVTAGSDDTFGGHLHHSGRQDDIRYSADMDWQKSAGWRANANYETYDARGRVQYDFDVASFAWLGLFYNHGSMRLPGPLTKAAMDADPRQVGTSWGVSCLHDEMETASFGGDTGARLENDNHLLDVAVSAQQRTRDASQPSSFYDADVTLRSVAVTPRYQWDGTVAQRQNIVTLGVDFLYDTLDADLPGTGDATLKRLNVAPYLRNEFFVVEDELSLAVGARWEYASTDFTATSFGVFDDGSAIARKSAFEAAVLYRPAQNQKYYARVTSVYRHPFMDEVAMYQGMGLGLNTHLKPEQGLLAEVGATVAIDEAWTVDGRVYQLDMRDEIAWGVNENVNMDKTRRHGIDLATTWTPGDYGSLMLAYQFVNAEFAKGDNDGKRIPLVPQHVLTLHGGVNVIPDTLALLGTWRAASSQYLGDDNANAARKIDGYGVLDIGVRLTLGDVSLLASCDNVLDKTYATTGFWGMGYGDDTYYPANGRTWRVTARYQF